MLGQIKALVFDRDGTLIEYVHYLADPKKVRLLPGVKTGIEILKEFGFRLFLHSNQSGVGRNYFNIEDVYTCNLRMAELLELNLDFFDRICIATEKPNDPITYRKPSPNFAKVIMQDFGFHSSEICYIGDSSSDLQTAIEVGSMAIGVNTGLVDLTHQLKELNLLEKFPVMNNFSETVKYLTSGYKS